MKCPECGTELPDGAFFCTGCGAMLEAALAASASIADDDRPADRSIQESALQQQYRFEQDAARSDAAQSGEHSYGWSFTPASSTRSGKGASARTIATGPSRSRRAKPATGPSRSRRAKPATGPDLTKRRSVSQKVIVLCGIVVVTFLVGGYVLTSGDLLDDGNVQPPVEQAPPLEQAPPTEQAPSDGTENPTGAPSSNDSFDGMSYTVPYGWKIHALDRGSSYDYYGEDGWGSIFVTNEGEGYTELDLDRQLESWTTSNDYKTVTEVVESKTMTIDGCPAAYSEAMIDSDGNALYESNLAVITPSGSLVQVWATCTGDSEQCKADIRSYIDSISFS